MLKVAKNSGLQRDTGSVQAVYAHHETMARGETDEVLQVRSSRRQGELALQCRACLQPGWNLPENWENIDPFYG
jgi:hypothetical protein